MTHDTINSLAGSLTLDLNRFPRGAKSSKLCTLDMLKTDGSVPQMSLFKHKRVKGWWPFAVKNEGNEELELTVSVIDCNSIQLLLDLFLISILILCFVCLIRMFPD